MRLESTVLTDLSANVFAALLLILIILLQAGGTPVPTAPVEATTDLAGRAREPMRPGDLVRFLHARRPGADGASIDLTATRIGVRTPGRRDDDVAASALPAALPGQGPVRLYVFSHRHYAAVTERLVAAGLRWDEISVPRALADPAGGWSPGFLALLERGADPAMFRKGLARLLAAAPGPLVPDGRSAGGKAAAAGSDALPGRLLRWLGVAVAVLALAAGAATVLAVEALVPRPHGDYRRVGGVSDRTGPAPAQGDPR